MTTIFWLKLYLLTIPVFFAIDMIWLGYAAKKFYQTRLHHLLSPEVNWPAAFLFYFIYIVGILFLPSAPDSRLNPWPRPVFTKSSFSGFFTYATYDLTNLATLRDWPIPVVLVDIAWGTLLCTLVGSGSYLIGAWLQVRRSKANENSIFHYTICQ